MMKQKSGRTLQGILFMLAMVIALMTGMSVTAYAATGFYEDYVLKSTDTASTSRTFFKYIDYYCKV